MHLFFFFLWLRTTMPSPICNYSKGPNRFGWVDCMCVCGMGGWWWLKGCLKKKDGGKKKKKKHHRCHEGQSHQLWNIHQWVGKCDGTVMTDEQATPPPPPHSSPQSLRPSLHQGGSTVDTLNMYNPENVLIFHLAKKGHKNHITWNCHSSFVHSSSLLMFGFCHKLSLITRYSELQSLSPQRHSHMQPAGLNKTAHIYYIWHTPSSFCFISD